MIDQKMEAPEKKMNRNPSLTSREMMPELLCFRENQLTPMHNNDTKIVDIPVNLKALH